MNDAEVFAAKHCIPCQGGIPPMTGEAAALYLRAVPDWQLGGEPMHLLRTVRFGDFVAAQDFAVKVGGVCEAEGHHAEITYGWGYCTIKFWTHKINGLHENDFVMAAKIDRLIG